MFLPLILLIFYVLQQYSSIYPSSIFRKKEELKIVEILIISKVKEKVPKKMTLINYIPTKITWIKNYVVNQKSTHLGNR